MRKKLFAVIMSAMMMITFMPAMAFAGTQLDNPDTTTVTKGYFAVSGFDTKLVTEDGEASFIYDGAEHTVTYTPSNVDVNGKWKVVSYTTAYKQATVATTTAPKEFNTTTAPVVKDAGTYWITAKVQRYGRDGGFVEDESYEYRYLLLTVAQRPVSVTNNAVVKKVQYTGQQVVVTDADLGVGTYTGDIADYKYMAWTVKPNSVIKFNGWFWTGNAEFKYEELTVETKYEFPYAWAGTSPAWRTAHSGLVAGDKLLTSEVKTASANVGVYTLDMTSATINPNYFIASKVGNEVKVEITQAKNVAKIASNTLTIKRGASKPVKFSTTFGTAKLEKVSTGNTKISVKNGKVYVKKGLKKGTYKIKVKCSATGNANYTDASRIKALKIKVK